MTSASEPVRGEGDASEDDALVERLARVLAVSDDGEGAWEANHPHDQELYRNNARAVLADLGIHLLGCMDTLGGVHLAVGVHEEHEHETGDPTCRLVVALNRVHVAHSPREDAPLP